MNDITLERIFRSSVLTNQDDRGQAQAAGRLIAPHPAPGWREYKNRNGTTYFNSPNLRTTTITNIRLGSLLQDVVLALSHIYPIIRAIPLGSPGGSLNEIPDGYEIYLEMDYTVQLRPVARYYLIDHFRRKLCWLPGSGSTLMPFIEDEMTTLTQYKLTSACCYWRHIQLFPLHVGATWRLRVRFEHLILKLLVQALVNPQSAPLQPNECGHLASRLANIGSMHSRSSAVVEEETLIIVGVALRMCQYYRIDPENPESRHARVPNEVMEILALDPDSSVASFESLDYEST